MLYKLPESGKGKSLKAIKLSSLKDANWKEKDLEDLLANNITQFIKEEQLMVIAQERSQQAEADILALDKEGTLYIFELKREQSNEENLLQVLRYGQKFGIYDYGRLEKLYKQYEKSEAARLKADHKSRFALEKPLQKNEFNKQQKFIIVVGGLDFNTLRAIKYWKEKGLPIEALVYRIYQIDDEFVMDFDPFGAQDDFDFAETRNHVVNTNQKWRPQAYKEMIDQEKVSAYGKRKTAVDSIQRKDRVFLYHSGKGFCAVGTAEKDVEEKDYLGVKGDEHFVKCRFSAKINPVDNEGKALKASEVHDVIDSKIIFMRTRFSIDDKIADKIEKMLKKKDKGSK